MSLCMHCINAELKSFEVLPGEMNACLCLHMLILDYDDDDDDVSY